MFEKFKDDEDFQVFVVERRIKEKEERAGYENSDEYIEEKEKINA